MNNKLAIKINNGYFCSIHTKCDNIENATIFYSPLDNDILLSTMKTLKQQGLQPRTIKLFNENIKL